MNPSPLRRQAETVAGLLRGLLRELTAGVNDPAIELPLAQLRVCSVLIGGARSMSAIRCELGVSLSAVTQIADRLERAGLVERVAQCGDRRVRCLQLTDAGERLMRTHDEIRIERMAALLDHLAPQRRCEVAVALQSLVDASHAARCTDANQAEILDVTTTPKVLL